MKEDELNRKLANVELPDIEVTGHRSRLRTALLESGRFKKQQEATIMETARSKTTGAVTGLWGRLVTPRPAWQIGLAAAVAVLLVATALFTMQPSGLEQASPIPGGGTTVVTDNPLTTEQKEQALAILAADPAFQELRRQGALLDMDMVLPVETVVQTASGEEITETWAQVRFDVGDVQWGAVIDLVGGKVVSLAD